MNLDDLVMPDSYACASAHEVAATYCSPALLNHSIRAYVWAAAHAALNDIGFDPELLYMSALLHDIGLVREFDNHTLPFEDAGAHIAWVLGAGLGWPVERRRRAGEIIVRHMWDAVPVADDPEGHLLERSTGVDISGRGVEDFPASFQDEVLAAYPRLGLGDEFIACFRDQARRKPDSRAAQLVANGIADRIAENALDT
jgi:hypothetical protein